MNNYDVWNLVFSENVKEFATFDEVFRHLESVDNSILMKFHLILKTTEYEDYPGFKWVEMYLKGNLKCSL